MYYPAFIHFVATGPTFNTKLARFRTGDVYKEINSFPTKYPANFGIDYQIKVSKALNIKDKFVLEPEVNLGNRFEFKKPQFGIGAAFKYKF